MAIEDIISGVGAQIGSASNGVGIGFGKGGLSISANFNQRLQSKLTKSKVNNDLKKLYQEDEELSADIIYPLDIDTDHYMLLKQVKRNKDKRSSRTDTNIIKNIVLPVPSNLNPQYSVTYKEEPMGVAGALAAGITNTEDFANAVGSAIGAGADATGSLAKYLMGTASENDTQRVKDLLGTASLATGAVAIGSSLGSGLGAFLAAKVGGVDTALQGALSRNGVALNSHMAVLFDNVGFRNFTFNYKFLPRNNKESQQLQKLISALKFAMYPSLPDSNRYLFKYPDEFEIQFAETINANLFKFKRCVLKDMSVNYNGDGVPRFFDETGAPVVVDIQMTFMETEIFTKEDFVNDDNVIEVEETPAL
jgi:hypothetical protein